MKIATRIVVEGRAVYSCPVCPKTTSTLGAVQLHAQKEHNEAIIGPGRPIGKSTTIQRGEPIIIGKEPELVRIIVSNGKAEREIITYASLMADVVELITGVLRQKGTK